MSTIIAATLIAFAMSLCAISHGSTQARLGGTAEQLSANTLWHAAAVPGTSYANADGDAPGAGVARATAYA